MALEKMSDEEREAIRLSLTAMCYGPFLEEFEFHTRMGVSRETIAALLKQWPNLDDSPAESDVVLAINNSLNELCFGIDISNEEWNRWLNFSRTRLMAIYRKWAELKHWTNTGIR
jgi:hypothetical protein